MSFFRRAEGYFPFPSLRGGSGGFSWCGMIVIWRTCFPVTIRVPQCREEKPPSMCFHNLRTHCEFSPWERSLNLWSLARLQEPVSCGIRDLQLRLRTTPWTMLGLGNFYFVAYWVCTLALFFFFTRPVQTYRSVIVCALAWFNIQSTCDLASSFIIASLLAIRAHCSRKKRRRPIWC